MVKLIINNVTYRIVKKGWLKEKDLVWNIKAKCFEFPASYSSQMVKWYYMVVRKV